MEANKGEFNRSRSRGEWRVVKYLKIYYDSDGLDEPLSNKHLCIPHCLHTVIHSSKHADILYEYKHSMTQKYTQTPAQTSASKQITSNMEEKNNNTVWNLAKAMRFFHQLLLQICIWLQGLMVSGWLPRLCCLT